VPEDERLVAVRWLRGRNISQVHLESDRLSRRCRYDCGGWLALLTQPSIHPTARETHQECGSGSRLATQIYTAMNRETA
jgi:hypothetical protein